MWDGLCDDGVEDVSGGRAFSAWDGVHMERMNMKTFPVLNDGTS